MSSTPYTNRALSECCELATQGFIEQAQPLLDLCREYETSPEYSDAPINAASHEMLAALKAILDMASRVWDLSDGSLILMPENIEKWDSAVHLGECAVARAEGKQPPVDE